MTIAIYCLTIGWDDHHVVGERSRRSAHGKHCEMKPSMSHIRWEIQLDVGHDVVKTMSLLPPVFLGIPLIEHGDFFCGMVQIRSCFWHILYTSVTLRISADWLDPHPFHLPLGYVLTAIPMSDGPRFLFVFPMIDVLQLWSNLQEIKFGVMFRPFYLHG